MGEWEIDSQRPPQLPAVREALAALAGRRKLPGRERGENDCLLVGLYGTNYDAKAERPNVNSSESKLRAWTTPAITIAVVLATVAPPYSPSATASDVEAPGGTGTIGSKNVDSYQPDESSDVLQIEFMGVTTLGVDYDFLNVALDADLAGKLELRTLGGFVPIDGDDFSFLSADNVNFEFESAVWTNPAPGLALELIYPPIPSGGFVAVRFVSPNDTANAAAQGSWNLSTTWVGGEVPQTDNDVSLQYLGGVSPVIAVDNDNAFANSVVVSGGADVLTLRVNANRFLSAIRGITIKSGGGLSGFGAVVGDVNNAGGTVSPGLLSGPPTGTLTIDGDYLQGPDGTLNIDIRNSQADLLAVSGDITLEGTLQLTVNDFFPAGPFPIARAQGDITLDLDGIAPGGLPPFTLTVHEVITQNGTENQLDAAEVEKYNFDLDPMNMVTPADVDDFLLALINPFAWKAAHETATFVPPTAGSLDGDVPGYDDLDPGLLTTDDIAGFNAALNANGYPGSLWNYLGVPEPASGAMLAISACIFLAQRMSRRHPPPSRCGPCEAHLSIGTAEHCCRGRVFLGQLRL